MDEGYEALTLMQTGKSQLMPLVLIDRPGGAYWKTWDKHVREHLLRDLLISPDDLNLYQITDDTDQAVKLITRFYRNFHSSRFVKDLFVIRLKHPPTDTALEALNEDFADIIVGPKIKRIEPTPEEIAEGEFVDMPRIAFGFNRHDYGRLRQLIDVAQRALSGARSEAATATLSRCDAVQRPFTSRLFRRSSGVTLDSTPSAGTLTLAVQRMALRTTLRKSSLPQFLW